MLVVGITRGTLHNRQSTNSLLAIRECWSSLRMKCAPSNSFIMIIKTLTINQMMGTVVLMYFIYSTVLYLKYLEAQTSLYFLGISVVGMPISVSIQDPGQYVSIWEITIAFFLTPKNSCFQVLRKMLQRFLKLTRNDPDPKLTRIQAYRPRILLIFRQIPF